MNNTITAVNSNVAGIYELARDALTILGEELLRGDSARVASAWSRMTGEEGDLLDSEAAYELRERVCHDIGLDRSEAGCRDVWVYGVFIELRLAYGRHWAVEALADYLRIFEATPYADAVSQGTWQRALDEYRKVLDIERESLPREELMPLEEEVREESV